MQISLTEPQEEFVKQAVSEGRYTSEAEVVNLGLRMVEEHDRKLARLRATIEESLKDTTFSPPKKSTEIWMRRKRSS